MFVGMLSGVWDVGKCVWSGCVGGYCECGHAWYVGMCGE